MNPPRACALVTGASSGIGRVLAARLARDGMRVVLVARRRAELVTLAEEIARAGGDAIVEVLDVGDTTRTASRVRALDAQLGGFDLIVANAGVGADDDAGRAPYEWETIAGACHVNFCGAAATLTAALPAMVARGRGHLVGVSSLASFGALPKSAAYCAPKAGLSMLLDCLRIDLEGTGVRVTTVHAGFVRTRMVDPSAHPTPLLMEVEEAVEIIARALPRAPARIDFPASLALAARAAGALPRPLRDRVARSLRGVR
jgi:short-subunit dehydrogenase